MDKVILYGGLGAILNCAIALHSSSLPLDHVVNDLLAQPFVVVKTLLFLPAAFGFIFGTAVMILWSFVKAIAVRSLLQYNGWFLNPRSPLNKIWYILMILLVGKKNLGAGNYQQYLPSLPLPPIKQTMKRYLESVKPLLTKEQFSKTEQIVKEFERKDGWKLQFFLKLRYWWYRNWLNDWWEQFVYLKQRTPISFNSNYYALGTYQPSTKHQIDRATMVVYNSVEYVKKLNVGQIPNMVANGMIPFCMFSAKYFGNTARIPGKEIDHFKLTNHNDIHHVVVLRQGKFYKIQVTTEDGRIFPPSLIKKQLEEVVEMAGDVLDETGVMTFTARPRTEWAEIRENLEKDPINKRTLELIDNAYVLVALETEAPPITDLTERASAIFHGNLYNRWFDKSVTKAIYSNGLVATNVEHGPLDATVGGQPWEYVLQNDEYDENGHVIESNYDCNQYPIDSPPEELKWNLEGFEFELEKSKNNLRQMIEDSDLVIVSPSYGKRIPKECKLSPDGWFQMAIQLAYYRMYHRLVLTYESATTRFYYKGRTETIRPVSMQSKAFVESMDDPNVTNEERKELLKAAIKYQEQYKFQAMRGMGIDRHLFGLYVVAKWLNIDPLPQLFQDEAFNMKFVLSTSQTPVNVIKKGNMDKTAISGGFGTATDVGYGVSYIVVGEDRVYYSIHCKKSCPTTSSVQFGEALKCAFEDMKDMYCDELK